MMGGSSDYDKRALRHEKKILRLGSMDPNCEGCGRSYDFRSLCSCANGSITCQNCRKAAGSSGTTIHAYGREKVIPIYSRAEFVERIFFRYVYGLGALCVGFNLPFDLSRIAIRAGAGRGRNRRKFRLTLTSKTKTYSAIHIEAISGRAAFIGFAKRNNLADWETPYFTGRFLDLSTLATALTGERFTLKRAASTFKTEHKKSRSDTLGIVTTETLEYGRNDVLVTWELFEKLRDEYCRYPFASMENERRQPKGSKSITRLYSTASVAKATLAMMGFAGQLPDDEELP